MSKTAREKTPRKSYYERYNEHQASSDTGQPTSPRKREKTMDSEDETRLRRSLLPYSYRYVEPLIIPPPISICHNEDHRLSERLMTSRMNVSYAELLRQLEEERLRSKDLEKTRARQASTLNEMETELKSLRANGYEGSTVLRDDNARLRQEVNRLKDEMDELRREARDKERERERERERDIPHALEWADRLAISERRVRKLEQQMADDARRWDVERSRLLAELAEYERRWVPLVTVPPPPMPRPIIIKEKTEGKPPWRYSHGPNSSVLDHKDH